MSLATDTLKKQQQIYLTGLIQALLLTGVGMWGGIAIYLNGIGNPPSNLHGLAGKFYTWMETTMAQSETAAKLVPLGFSALFFFIAGIGMFHMFRAGKQMASSRTLLGKSLLIQAKDGETLSQLLDAIDTDMEQEPLRFDKISIGRRWILGQEAMRLSEIRGVFFHDAGMEDYVLCCVDQEKNIWATGCCYQDDRDKAMAYLMETLPNLVTGDKDACARFVGCETIDIS